MAYAHSGKCLTFPRHSSLTHAVATHGAGVNSTTAELCSKSPDRHLLMPLNLVLLVVLLQDALAQSTVCTILQTAIPTPWQDACGCASASNGVGGETTCSLVVPSQPVEVVPPAIVIPTVTFSIGAEVLPCGNAASATVKASVTLPNSLPTEITAQLQDSSGITLSLGDENTATIERRVEAGGSAENIDVPFWTSAIVTASFRISLGVTGHIGALTVSLSLDVCLTAPGNYEFCGADLPTCQNLAFDGTPSGIAISTLCSATSNFNFNAAFGSPPYELLSQSHSFSDACSTSVASGSSSSSSSGASSSGASSSCQAGTGSFCCEDDPTNPNYVCSAGTSCGRGICVPAGSTLCGCTGQNFCAAGTTCCGETCCSTTSFCGGDATSCSCSSNA